MRDSAVAAVEGRGDRADIHTEAGFISLITVNQSRRLKFPNNYTRLVILPLNIYISSKQLTDLLFIYSCHVLTSFCVSFDQFESINS